MNHPPTIHPGHLVPSPSPSPIDLDLDFDLDLDADLDLDLDADLEIDVDVNVDLEPEHVLACASCHSGSDLVLVVEQNQVAFCRECLTPLSSLAFSELYVDLGGGD